MKKVLIVDDHPMIRMIVRMMLEHGNYQVVGETGNGVDAIALAREHQPDLVILDIGIPRLDGLEVIMRLQRLPTALKVLVLTGQSSERYAVRCMQAGAAGFVCKEGDQSELLAAVHAVLSGYNYFPNQVLLHSTQRPTVIPREAELIDTLSYRELAVLRGLANGYTNIEIAKQLLISNKTVSTYKARLQLKLNVHSLMGLCELAKRNALV